jgi:hypothetical protein
MATRASTAKAAPDEAVVGTEGTPGHSMQVVTEGQGLPRIPEHIEPSELNLYQRIAAISREAGALAPESKGGVPFAFRGVDGTVAHLTPFLNKYGVFLAPAGISHVVTEREVGSRVVKTSQVEQKFDVYGPDGYGFTIETAGLADDFADRSTAQAQSVAYRIALLQLFHLPTHTKEPEETGQDVLNAAATDAPRGPKAVEAAKASAPSATPVARLQQEAKALGRKLNMEPSVLNDKGAELSGGKDVDTWFNDALIMEQIVDWLKGQDKS